MKHRRIRLVLLAMGPLAAAILAGPTAPPASAQTPAPIPGLQQTRGFMDRAVRVAGRQTPGLPGENGYGVIVGERPGPQGALLVIIVPDHIVRDPTRPDARFTPPLIVFPADPTQATVAQLLDERLAPEEGDLAVMTVPKPVNQRSRPAVMANSDLLIAGSPAWQTGRAAEFAPNPVPGRFALRDRSGWLTFEALDNAPASSGAAVIGERGFVGLLIGPAASDRLLTRVLAAVTIAARLRAWGLPWDIAAAASLSIDPPRGGVAAITGSGSSAPAPTVPTSVEPKETTTAAAPIQLAPLQIVRLLPAEAAARASWTPPGAKVSPWMDTPMRLFSSPRRDAPQIATLPAGRLLPLFLLSRGAYDIAAKLDGGAWFLLETGGQPIGYAAGADLVEIWPMQATAGLSGGKVLREWNVAGGQVALLRDAGNVYELETAVTCKADRCYTIIAYTPAPPDTGAVIPTLQVLPLTGTWRRDDVIAIRLLVPRRVVETATARLLGCVGREGDCSVETLLPPPAR